MKASLTERTKKRKALREKTRGKTEVVPGPLMEYIESMRADIPNLIGGKGAFSKLDQAAENLAKATGRTTAEIYEAAELIMVSHAQHSAASLRSLPKVMFAMDEDIRNSSGQGS